MDHITTVTSQWVRLRLKSPASRLFTQLFIQTQIKENIKAVRHWPLWPMLGEFPAQMAIIADNFSIWWRHHVSWGFAPLLYLTSTKNHNSLKFHLSGNMVFSVCTQFTWQKLLVRHSHLLNDMNGTFLSAFMGYKLPFQRPTAHVFQIRSCNQP